MEMEIMQLVLLVFAYSLGLVTIFVQFICYSRNIEFKETIFLSVSFLLLIIAVTSNYFVPADDTSEATLIFIIIALTLVGLTTPLNVFKEREVAIQPFFKKIIIGVAAVIILASVFSYFLNFIPILEYISGGFLLVMVFYSMLIVRTSDPSSRVKHRERMERITAILCLCILPIALIIDYFPAFIPFDTFNTGNPLKLTLPLLFIFIAMGKLIDDVKRLSLFKPEMNSSDQNMKNYNFTNREKEIVDLIIKGSTYNQISDALFISLPTVKTHISNIYRKAEVNNKIGLINLVKI
ncbi:MAG: DNA-binding CsgD family transcriptional regulator [Crocinitomix sp.]|jgi:DNA-binding CsgD family transcriptional regulator